MEQDLTKGSPIKIICKLSLPLIFGSFFQQLYIAADSIIVGNFIDSNALAAIGAAIPITFFLISLLLGFSMGLSVVVSQYFGAKEYKKLKLAISSATIILFALTFIIAILGWYKSEYLLISLNTPAEILKDSSSYLKIIFAGIIFTLYYDILFAVLYGVGDTKTPFFILLAATIINIVLDLFFIVVLKYGVEGAAYATIFSQLLSSVGFLFYVKRKVPKVFIKLNEYRLDFIEAKKIMRYGGASSIQYISLSLSFLVLQWLVNSFGISTVAGYVAATRVESFVAMVYINVGTAYTSFVGQNFGSKIYARIKQGLFSSVQIVFISSLVLIPSLYFFGSSLIELFLNNDSNVEILNIGTMYLQEIAIFYVFLGISYAYLGFFRGIGDNFWASIIFIISLALKVIFAYTLVDFIGVRSLWYSAGISWIFMLIVCHIRYKKKISSFD